MVSGRIAKFKACNRMVWSSPSITWALHNRYTDAVTDMSQYSGSVRGSRDNLDEHNPRNPPVPQARQPPTPTDRPYARQYVRNQPYNPNEPPPSYG